MTRPLLALCAMVRDEEHAIRRTLKSCRGVVDRWFILDTGSKDRTVEVVRSFLGEESAGRQSVVGRLDEEPFEDYASSRNRALSMADLLDESERPVWALSLSADEMLHGGQRLRDFLARYDGPESAILVEVRTPGGVFDYPRVLRVGSPWHYEGEIHEAPVHQEDRQRVPTVKVSGCYIEYAPTDPARLARRLRERDLPILMRQLAQAKDGPSRARVVTLLAQTREQIAAGIMDDVASASQEMFSALGWYMYLSMSEDLPGEARRYGAWKYLSVAEILGIYLSRELVPRLQFAAKGDPKNPAVAYLLARHTANIDGDGRVQGDARAGMQAALRAAQVADDAVEDPTHPHDPHGLRWRSHFIAAACARSLGYTPAARKSAEAGLARGGPRGVFEPYLK